MKSPKYKNGFAVTCHDDDEKLMSQPLRWKRPRMVFVCSMGDLFHDDVPISFIDKVYDVMEKAPQHTFQVLTKRVQNMAEYVMHRGVDNIPGNVWHGVTVESNALGYRARILSQLMIPNKFISYEPLIGDPLIGDPAYAFSQRAMDYLGSIDSIIIGGESGPGARHLEISWLTGLIDMAHKSSCRVFVKQLGTEWANSEGLRGKGDKPEQWPEVLRVQEDIWWQGKS